MLGEQESSKSSKRLQKITKTIALTRRARLLTLCAVRATAFSMAPKKRPPRGPRVLCCQWLKSNANRPVLEDACRAKKLEFTKKTTRFQLAQLLHPELPDFCENHEHKRR